MAGEGNYGIDRLLDGAAFDDNAGKIMTTAYEETLRELKLDSTRPVTEIVAKKKRRDRLPSILKSKSMAVEQRLHDVLKAKPQVTPASHSELALTRGQMNAIRAAFKAGVKPSVIARQFVISQSDVRKALTSGTWQRKS